jgi:hypothetical protein
MVVVVILTNVQYLCFEQLLHCKRNKIHFVKHTMFNYRRATQVRLYLLMLLFRNKGVPHLVKEMHRKTPCLFRRVLGPRVYG